MKNINILNKMAGAAFALGALGVSTQASAADSAHKGKLILNEYNAVGPAAQLEDCDLTPQEGDIFFGCVNGNGSNWIELVVTGDDLDIGGWKVYWQNSDSNTHGNNGSFVFSSLASTWENLRAGTVITVHDNGDATYNTGYTGAPCTDENWWIDAAALDTSLIVDAEILASTPADGFKTDNDDWRMKIVDANGDLVLDWVGESIFGLSGVGSDEVCKLEENPAFGIAAGDSYNDGDCSTFGGPNCHTGGGWVQSLSALCNATCGGSGGCCGGGASDYSCYDANVEQYYY